MQTKLQEPELTSTAFGALHANGFATGSDVESTGGTTACRCYPRGRRGRESGCDG
jgi:hypothetical protein